MSLLFSLSVGRQEIILPKCQLVNKFSLVTITNLPHTVPLATLWVLSDRGLVLYFWGSGLIFCTTKINSKSFLAENWIVVRGSIQAWSLASGQRHKTENKVLSQDTVSSTVNKCPGLFYSFIILVQRQVAHANLNFPPHKCLYFLHALCAKLC